MKISYSVFRKYIANTLIALTLLLVGLITYQGGTKGVFSSTNADIIYAGNTNNNSVALMFNVYEGNDCVEKIIEILEQNEIKATFFVGGVWVNKNEDCFMKIYNSGNEIGSHGYWHKDHSKISDDEQANEILLTDDLVYRLTGVKMSLFAPPSGAFNKRTAEIAKNLGYKTIMWSKDTIDWRDNDVNLIIDRATSKVQTGDLILMHPKEQTVQALPQIIKTIKNKGLKLTTVGECLSWIFNQIFVRIFNKVFWLNLRYFLTNGILIFVWQFINLKMKNQSIKTMSIIKR